MEAKCTSLVFWGDVWIYAPKSIRPGNRCSQNAAIRRIHDFWSSNCHFESTGAVSSEARPFFFGWKTIAAISSQQHHLTDQTSWYWHISTEIQNRMWSWCQKERFQIHKISSKNIKYRSLEVGNGVVQEKRSRKSWWSFPASKNCPGDRNKYLGGIVASFPSKSCRVWDREREGGTEREGERARKMAKGQLARFRFGVLERGMILMTAILLLRAHKADSGWRLPFLRLVSENWWMVSSPDGASINEAMQFKSGLQLWHFVTTFIPSQFYLSGLPYFAFQHRPVKPRQGCPSLGWSSAAITNIQKLCALQYCKDQKLT